MLARGERSSSLRLETKKKVMSINVGMDPVAYNPITVTRPVVLMPRYELKHRFYTSKEPNLQPSFQEIRKSKSQTFFCS